MRIPEIRNHLAAMAENLEAMAVDLAGDAADLQAKARHLRLCIEELHRRPAVKTAVKSKTMTPTMARKIRAYVKAHPGLSRAEVARRFGVNSGRVTEAVRGKRK